MQFGEKIKMKGLSMLLSCAVLCSCSDSSTYTLYRNSVTNENMRLHVATFDARDGYDYNSSNCQIAADLFQNQDGVKTKFWCEKGKFRK